MTDTKDYVVLGEEGTTVLIKDVELAVGDVVALTDEEAAPLLADGKVKLAEESASADNGEAAA